MSSCKTCESERRHMQRRKTDRSSSWKLIVAMGLVFISWSGLVYLHWLISNNFV